MKDLNEKYRNPDWDRITHMFKIGILASLFALIGGDMLIGLRTHDIRNADTFMLEDAVIHVEELFESRQSYGLEL